MEIQGIDISELELDNIGRWPSVVRYSLLLLSAMITFVLGYYIDLNSQIELLKNIAHQREKLQSEYIEIHERVATIEAYQEQVKTLQENFVNITHQLPQNNEESGLLEDISQMAQKSGLQIFSIKPISVEQRDFYMEESIELQLVGNYHGFGEFVSNTSNMSRIVTLQDFSIKIADKDNTVSSPEALEMIVILKTYWSKPGGKKI